jgi:hypothetical protein
VKGASPARGRAHGQPGQAPHHRSGWPAPPGGWLRLSEIGDRLSDDQIRALGLEPARRGWRALTPELNQRLTEAATRTGPGNYEGYIPFSIPGPDVECIVCGEPAPPSSCDSPVCGGICAGVLMERVLEHAEELYTRGDGSGGTPAIRPAAPPKPKLRPIAPGRPSVERALERLGSVRDVLERHGVDVRWGRVARCPLHDDEHPSMSLYERRGRSRAHCFPCDFDGDAIDLESAISGEDVATTIRRWGSS